MGHPSAIKGNKAALKITFPSEALRRYAIMKKVFIATVLLALTACEKRPLSFESRFQQIQSGKDKVYSLAFGKKCPAGYFNPFLMGKVLFVLKPYTKAQRQLPEEKRTGILCKRR